MFSLADQIIWYLRSTFAYAVINLSVSAVQIFMWIYILSLCVEAQPMIRKRRLPYIVASLIILSLSSAAAILRGLYAYHTLYNTTPGAEDVGANKAIADDLWVKFSALANLLGDIAIRVADLVLVYRCYIIWVSYPWVAAFPACLWLVAAGINIRTYIPFGFWNETLNAVGISLTVALNIVITSLITYRLIRAYKRLAIALPHTDHRLYFSIVAILVESAAPIGVFGLCVIITRLLSDTSNTAWKAAPVFNILYDAVAILGPQLIVFRVATGVSWTNKSETSVALSRGIMFVDQDHIKCEGDSP